MVTLSSVSGDPAFARVADELLARLAADGAGDIERMLSEHPEHADRLRKLLPSLTALAMWRRAETENASLESPATASCRTLGDFQLHQEIGRGGNCGREPLKPAVSTFSTLLGRHNGQVWRARTWPLA